MTSHPSANPKYTRNADLYVFKNLNLKNLVDDLEIIIFYL